MTFSKVQKTLEKVLGDDYPFSASITIRSASEIFW